MRPFKHLFVASVVVVLLAVPAVTQENDNLQIHFIDVGQGDAAPLISPLGETVLFDNGVRNHCDLPVAYLQGLGVTRTDYHIAVHYHDDHIGCTRQVLTQAPLQKAAYLAEGHYLARAN